MPLNQANTLATFLFTGLAIFEFNDQNQCAVKIVQCPEHDLSVHINEISLDPQNGRDASSRIVPYKLDPQDDLDIRLVYAAATPANDARRHLVPSPNGNPNQDFNRAANRGDANDFRWILDIEAEVQKMPLQEKSNPGSISLKPKLVFNHGLFYTVAKETLPFTLTALDKPLEAQTNHMLGHIAAVIGVDIASPPQAGSKVVLKAGSGATQELIWKPNTRYQIALDNACTRSPDEPIATDLMIYYQVLEPVSGSLTQVDLRQVIQHNGNPGAGKTLADAPNFTVDSLHQACDMVTKAPSP